MSILTALEGLQNVNKKIELLPHNQMLYDQIVKELVNGQKSIFYSEATGLGKSYIFMRLVQDFFLDKRIMYITPKIAVWENLTHYSEFDLIGDNIEMKTFTAFNTYPNESFSCEEYDVVFVDECHHMLSDIQGKNVQQFLNDMVASNKKVFGFTATPYVKETFIDEECFDVSCYGLDMYEAIEQGFMPKMDIAVGIREELDISDDLRERYSIVGTKTLLEKVIEDYSHVTHWLAYFTTKEELEQNESELRKLFPEFKVLKAYHGLDNTGVIEEFENSSEPVVLMSVSMFLEGMHLKHVGGILLYRNVMFSHTYAQILGRLCVLGQEVAPVMVDIPGAILGIKDFSMPKSSRFVGERKVYSRKDIFDVTSRGYELLELAEALAVLNDRRWTEDEDNILKEYYGAEGLKVAERLPGRSEKNCHYRASVLGLKSDSFWTEEEIQILIMYYPSEGVAVKTKLPSRSIASIKGKARSLGIRYNEAIEVKPWTEDELQVLMQFYTTEGGEVYKKLPGRSRANVQNKASALGISYKYAGAYWSVDDTEILKMYYPKEGREAFKRLPNFSEGVCKMKVKELGLISPRTWTEEEIETLVANFSVLGEDVVKLIPRHDLKSCMAKAYAMKLVPNPRWSREEEEVLKTFYPKEGTACFKRLPGKSKIQCKTKVHKMGLHVEQTKLSNWTRDEDLVLHTYYPAEGSAVCQRLPGRTAEACKSRAKAIGVKRVF